MAGSPPSVWPIFSICSGRDEIRMSELLSVSIRIFVTAGDPNGLCNHRSNWPGKALVFPRSFQAAREAATVPIDGWPGRKVAAWEQPPSRAHACDGRHRLEHLAHRHAARTSTGSGLGQQRRAPGPASVVHSGGIAFLAAALLVAMSKWPTFDLILPAPELLKHALRDHRPSAIVADARSAR
jgi:hypothetical protein